MTKRLTKKEKEFADRVLETGSQRQAYLQTYDTKGHIPTVDPNASRIASKEHVANYLEAKLETAKSIIENLALNASNEAVRLQAAKDMADRIEGKPVQRQINANADSDKTYKWAE